MLKMSELAHGVVAFGVALLAGCGSIADARPTEVEARLDAPAVRVLDERGAPLLGAKVRISGAGGLCRTRVSGGEGRVEFERLPAGSYEVIGSATGSRTRIERVELSDAPLELRLAPLALLAVDVRTPAGESYLQAVEDCEHDELRSTLQSMLAIATAEAPPKVLPIGLGGDERDYGIGTWLAVREPGQRFGHLRVDAQGDYFVSLVVAEFVIATQRVSLEAKTVRFELDPGTVIAAGATLRGRLVDPAGAPVSSVSVGWQTRRGRSSWGLQGFGIRPGADGRFEFSGLMENTVTLRIDDSWHLLPKLRLEPGVVLDLGDVVFGGPCNSDFKNWALGSASFGFGGPLDFISAFSKGFELPAGYGSVRVQVEGPSDAPLATTWSLTRVGPDGSTTHPPIECNRIIQFGDHRIAPLVPGNYAVAAEWPETASIGCARLAPFEITAGATAEVMLRIERSGALVLEPAGRASIGTRYRVRDEATGLVNSAGLIERDESMLLVLPRGPWQIELDLPDGARRSESVTVGGRSTHVALPR